MKIAIGNESLNVKDTDWAWVLELQEIGREDKIGDFSRRIWTETDREKVKFWWKEAPLWFRKAAGPILGGKFTPKAKPKSKWAEMMTEAIDSFTNQTTQEDA